MQANLLLAQLSAATVDAKPASTVPSSGASGFSPLMAELLGTARLHPENLDPAALAALQAEQNAALAGQELPPSTLPASGMSADAASALLALQEAQTAELPASGALTQKMERAGTAEAVAAPIVPVEAAEGDEGALIQAPLQAQALEASMPATDDQAANVPSTDAAAAESQEVAIESQPAPAVTGADSDQTVEPMLTAPFLVAQNLSEGRGLRAAIASDTRAPAPVLTKLALFRGGMLPVTPPSLYVPTAELEQPAPPHGRAVPTAVQTSSNKAEADLIPAKVQVEEVASARSGFHNLAFTSEESVSASTERMLPEGLRLATHRAEGLRFQPTAHALPGEQVRLQLSHALQNGKQHMTIQLNPLELGKVEIRMEVARDGQTQMTVQADRPETLDLLQRDVRFLERALQDGGLKAESGSIQFQLRGDSQQQNASSQQHQHQHGQQAAAQSGGDEHQSHPQQQALIEWIDDASAIAHLERGLNDIPESLLQSGLLGSLSSAYQPQHYRMHLDMQA